MLITLLKTNKFIHFFLNSFLFLNFTLISGKGNSVSGRLSGLLTKSRLRVKGGGNSVEYGTGVRLNGTRIFITGSGNKVIIDKGCSLDGTLIWIDGCDNTLILKEDCHIARTEIGMENSGNTIVLSKKARLGGFKQLGLFKKNNTEFIKVYANESTQITIGEDCAISDGVTVRTSDSHPIFDETGTRINHAKNISVGNRVWVCSGASLLKGAAIGDGSVLGLKSMLTKDLSQQKKCLLAGTPARIMRENISWQLPLDDQPDGR